MQSLCRLYLHRPACRNAYTNRNHQSYQQEADGSAKQQTLPLQGRTVAPGVQFHACQIIVYEQSNRRDKQQQKQPFAYQTGENTHVRCSMHLMQGNLRTALLGTEPESAEQSQKYIQQQKSHTHYVIAQVIAPCLLEITADVLKGTYFGDKDIADAELFLTVRFQALDEICLLYTSPSPRDTR